MMREFESLRPALAYLPPDEIGTIEQAYEFSRNAHEGQFRKSGEPYISHPLAVAGILAGWHLDTQTLTAALLHDVVEDTPATAGEIETRFGKAVALLVEGVSKLDKLAFASEQQAQAENFRKMLLAMAQDVRVILVKLADRLHNMHTMGAMPAEKRRRIAAETLDIYAPIANRLGLHSVYQELEDLGFRYSHPNRYQVLSKAVKAARGNRRELVDKVRIALQEKLELCKVEATITGREKHLYSIYRKMQEKNLAFSEVFDIYGFRVVVRDQPSCYLALGALHSLYKPIPGKFKDYIAIPKANGYQSLHSILFGPNGTPIEVQIRTTDMNRLAESGVASHWMYKSADTALNEVQTRTHRWLQSLLDIQADHGDSPEFLEHIKVDLFPDEVYVFTPKGKIMALPRGATAVDFAFAVHTDVGRHCVAVKINYELMPLRTQLRNGDHVEILTAANASPNAAWLNFVVTGKARTHIRHALKLQRRSESINLGERLLSKALSGFETSLDKISPERIQQVLAEYHMEYVEDLLEDIGLGNRMAYVIARRLIARDDEQAPALEGPLAIRGTEGLVLNYAKCCTPIPGDPIVGHLSAGKGMVVHLETCRNIADVRHNPDKCIQLSWSKDVTGEFNVELRVELEHQRGLIALLAGSVNAADGNIEKIGMDERDGRISVVQLVVSVHDRVHLARVIKKLRTIKGVTRITRVKA